MYDCVALREELFKCGGTGEVALDKGYAQRLQMRGPGRISDQRANMKALFKQALAEKGTDKACRAGNGDETAVGNQAEATLRRTSSTAASSMSMSLPLMKSSRALARDNLPDEVRGKE